MLCRRHDLVLVGTQAGKLGTRLRWSELLVTSAPIATLAYVLSNLGRAGL
jgi:hypothetical protein